MQVIQGSIYVEAGLAGFEVSGSYTVHPLFLAQVEFASNLLVDEDNPTLFTKFVIVHY